MIGFSEFAICFALTVTFVGYAVWKSPAVRVFGWVLFVGTTAWALAPSRPVLVVTAAAIALPVAAFAEWQAPRNKRGPGG